jgi:hypothetical protein
MAWWDFVRRLDDDDDDDENRINVVDIETDPTRT